MVSPANSGDDGSGWTAINGVVSQEDIEYNSGLCGQLQDSVSFPGVRFSGRSVGELEIEG